MSFTYGFYNSIDGDRKYDADQFGDLFSGIITDGVYSSIGDALMVSPGGGLSVVVGTGRAWFNKTWNYNSTRMTLALDLADLLLPRYDMVVLEVNKNSFSRSNSIKVITGMPSANPEKPTYVREGNIYQYPLAYIYVAANQETTEAKDIEVTVGRDPCPFVTGILEHADITTMYQHWEQQFSDWFKKVQTTLSDDAAGALLYRIEQVEEKLSQTQNELLTITTKIDDTTSIINRATNQHYILDIITTSRTWTPPDTIDTRYPLIFIAIGGGGGGGLIAARYNNNNTAIENVNYVLGGGGGSGRVAIAYFNYASLNAYPIKVEIGLGGKGAGYTTSTVDGVFTATYILAEVGKRTVFEPNGIQFISANGGNGGGSYDVLSYDADVTSMSPTNGGSGESGGMPGKIFYNRSGEIGGTTTYLKIGVPGSGSVTSGFGNTSVSVQNNWTALLVGAGGSPLSPGKIRLYKAETVFAEGANPSMVGILTANGYKTIAGGAGGDAAGGNVSLSTTKGRSGSNGVAAILYKTKS